MTPVVTRLNQNDATIAKAVYATVMQGDFPIKGKEIKQLNSLFCWLENLSSRIEETLKPPLPLKFTEIKKEKK